jgi:hypothetical protein
MRSILVFAAGLVSVLVLGGAGDMRQLGAPLTVYGNAPIGHLQPHAQGFSPASAAEQTEQNEMSKFDAEQRKLDEQLDKSLNICRHC